LVFIPLEKIQILAFPTVATNYFVVIYMYEILAIDHMNFVCAFLDLFFLLMILQTWQLYFFPSLGNINDD
ncbi:hypothetical protein ACJX0J_035454, partial [Zea mays]